MNQCNPPHVFADSAIVVPGLHRRRAVCRAVAICRGGDKSVVMILSELRSNPGASVTNIVEIFAFYAAMTFGISIDCVTWVEHHPNHGRKDETFHLVEFSELPSLHHRPDSLGPPTWRKSSRAVVERMIGLELGAMLSGRKS